MRLMALAMSAKNAFDAAEELMQQAGVRRCPHWWRDVP